MIVSSVCNEACTNPEGKAYTNIHCVDLLPVLKLTLIMSVAQIIRYTQLHSPADTAMQTWWQSLGLADLLSSFPSQSHRRSYGFMLSVQYGRQESVWLAASSRDCGKQWKKAGLQ